MNNEPVAWMPIQSKHTRIVEAKPDDEQNWIPLYLHPAKTLTDEEITAIANDLTCTADKNWNVLFARAILKKAQEK